MAVFECVQGYQSSGSNASVFLSCAHIVNDSVNTIYIVSVVCARACHTAARRCPLNAAHSWAAPVPSLPCPHCSASASAAAAVIAAGYCHGAACKAARIPTCGCWATAVIGGCVTRLSRRGTDPRCCGVHAAWRTHWKGGHPSAPIKHV